MVSIKVFVTSLLATGSLAIPLKPDEPKPSLDESFNVHEAIGLTTTFFDSTEKREASGKGADLEKRCVWNDGHGDIDCNFFSVVFGDNSVGGSKGTITIRGSEWKTDGGLNCGGDQWTSFTSPLPFTVDIHGGNACKTTISSHFDGTWIKYSAQWLDVPSDTRCGDVGTLNKSRRCIVPIN
ncbi:hypothetical protein FZEAL_3873 [Fusarium zealandicum]|uniref:Uncharacterized protein n=1 Tax=Fusarium zealandicum TaxID=1053134 RepID=A0A8H4UNK5_9HYPO|nr:hypothetical protein FZEAL_3873 [Fusarium zealandicum]